MKATLILLVAAPLHAAFVGPPAMGRYAKLKMSAATDVVDSFVAATERGDAAAATAVCAEDLLYKTHSATTDSLAAAAKRLKTKVPKPKSVKTELHEESPGVFVREIVVKPVPFVTVGVRQEFEVRCTDEEGVTVTDEEEADSCELTRAEYTKTSGGKD
mmetsp:Transcript_41308/g.132846  ORF Transcript_41308/g.132846 Transcript_41308/m.132846 type:complete len:159 (+) Transcript_41308:27-503(+)